ncbi:chorismate synthase [Syntrophorhabdus aromaticivorans]|uniref:chorismate synthase n=1 Tax=Syntrophorhabdus aromaticivorans TaxID=328301 RepID=UPI000425B1A8|nr:chorismate synthase [Syntrophorhabdus aromaticivorans]
MNAFGRLFRISILGESHGPCVGILIDGCPAGLSISEGEFASDLERRRGGRKGTTPRKEADVPYLKTGVFNGKTTGMPLLILFENKDTDSEAYERIKFTPRPGQADFVAFQKFGGFNDYRGGGHFSGRLTAGLVAAGVIAKKVLAPITVEAKLAEAGGSSDIEGAVDAAIEKQDSIGGIVECVVTGLPIGLGEPFFDSVESLISHIVFSIPAVRGIEFGAGFAAARMKGSEHNDELLSSDGRTKTNNAGGVNGGITNGNDVRFRVAVKPTSSISTIQHTIDIRSGEPVDLSVGGRHDVCIALRMPVIVEAAAAIVFADLMLVEHKTKRIR